MRTNSVLKRTYNGLLAEIAALPVGAALGSEPELARILRVSRTTVRAALAQAQERGLLIVSSRRRVTLRHPQPGEFFASVETEAVSESAERRFLNYVLKDGLSAGDVINGLALSRSLGTSPTALRDYLGRFERFGLVEKQPNTSWIFLGFTKEFAIELFTVRQMFELHAIRAFFLKRGPDEMRAIDRLEVKHRLLLERIEVDFHQFSELDAEFHRELTRAADNRFINQFQELISLVFHYHYQWHKADERERNQNAIYEHLEVLAALRGDDLQAVLTACRRHLTSAKQTLLRSIAINGATPRRQAAFGARLFGGKSDDVRPEAKRK